MYLPYDKIGSTISLLMHPKYGTKILKIFNKLKVHSNCKYIENNSKKVIKKLRKAIKHRKIRVAFLCDECTKWKCQSLYELFLQSDKFEPFILATKNCAPHFAAAPMTAENVKNTYNFFINKGFETYYAYDINKEKHIPVKNFKPDIIFYQDPWYIETLQGPVVCSKFSLTYYVPYFVTNLDCETEYNLRFHRYIHKHYILNNLIRDFYSKRMDNHGKNLKVTGHTQLDYFYLNKTNGEKNYVIYAPHWSINFERERYATFEWNGLHILEFAKKHPEINWVFKPHPCLKLRLKTQKILTPEDIENYWNEWDEIGIKYESGDYMDLFKNSYAMITDCGSFLTEYLLTENPVIHLVQTPIGAYNPSASAIINNYYRASNLDELDKLLKLVILDKKDPMKEMRLQAIENLGFKNVYAAQNILKDIEEELHA